LGNHKTSLFGLESLLSVDVDRLAKKVHEYSASWSSVEDMHVQGLNVKLSRHFPKNLEQASRHFSRSLEQAVRLKAAGTLCSPVCFCLPRYERQVGADIKS